MDTAARSLAAPPSRLASIDAYRGLVMFLMMAEVLHLSTVGKATGSPFWRFLGEQQTLPQAAGEPNLAPGPAAELGRWVLAKLRVESATHIDHLLDTLEGSSPSELIASDPKSGLRRIATRWRCLWARRQTRLGRRVKTGVFRRSIR